MSPAPATRLYLARHCDVRNPEGVLYGHLPGFPLSDKGVGQAHALGAFLAGASIRRIYASPLERAQETGSIVASHLSDVSIETTDELTEARFGLYLQGIKPAQVPWRRPLWFIHIARPGLLRRDERVPDMAARVNAPLMRLLRDYPGESGLCISHGDPIQAFWLTADGLPTRALHRLQCAKGGLLALDYEGEVLVKRTYLSPERIGEITGLGADPPARRAESNGFRG